MEKGCREAAFLFLFFFAFFFYFFLFFFFVLFQMFFYFLHHAIMLNKQNNLQNIDNHIVIDIRGSKILNLYSFCIPICTSPFCLTKHFGALCRGEEIPFGNGVEVILYMRRFVALWICNLFVPPQFTLTATFHSRRESNFEMRSIQRS